MFINSIIVIFFKNKNKTKTDEKIPLQTEILQTEEDVTKSVFKLTFFLLNEFQQKQQKQNGMSVKCAAIIGFIRNNE